MCIISAIDGGDLIHVPINQLFVNTSACGVCDGYEVQRTWSSGSSRRLDSQTT
ncbi:hypothetical protein PILCRDRAFT_829569 [Piloderma croceum F 1598]|uniref:Uncharacterized protein n=1 Tax=Piloderma croceum (strain F 1598) TaxID=765440 RepID=A0A0C3AG70_PILCF|nr:hypothetical protein PILCRDRAFT_829569 [Piloderma croceum F 1598]